MIEDTKPSPSAGRDSLRPAFRKNARLSDTDYIDMDDAQFDRGRQCLGTKRRGGIPWGEGANTYRP